MSPGLLAAAVTATASEPSIGSSLLHMVLGLAAVIAAILGVTKVLQFVRGGASPRSRSRAGSVAAELEIVSRRSIGKGVQLAIVRYRGREVLVGLAGQHITFYEEKALAVTPAPVTPVAVPVTEVPVTQVPGMQVPGAQVTETGALVRAAAAGTNGEVSLAELETMLRRAPALALGESPYGSYGTATSLLERLRAVTERH